MEEDSRCFLRCHPSVFRLNCILTISNIDNIMGLELSIFDIGGDDVPRAKFQTLTEQMYYVLLCLHEECYGMDIMEKVRAMTEGRVLVGSGTLYNLLEQFAAAGMIRETKAQGRRRSYILTEKGRDALEAEYRRLLLQAEDFRRILGGGGEA